MEGREFRRSINVFFPLSTHTNMCKSCSVMSELHLKAEEGVLWKRVEFLDLQVSLKLQVKLQELQPQCSTDVAPCFKRLIPVKDEL